MREIKFRAWDEVHKEMFQVTSLGSAFSDDDSLKFGDGTPLMQYTGLKDKYGREIYEGDILKYQNSPDYIVGFSDGSFVMVIRTRDDEGQILMNNSRVNFMSVIGNIYENL